MYHFTCVFLVEQLIANGTFNISVSSQGSEGKEKLLQNSIYGQFFSHENYIDHSLLPVKAKKGKGYNPNAV